LIPEIIRKQYEKKLERHKTCIFGAPKKQHGLIWMEICGRHGLRSSETCSHMKNKKEDSDDIQKAYTRQLKRFHN
jgi:hypothetical protein